MAISATGLTSGGSATDAASYATSSISPSASRLVLAVVVNTHGSNATLPTISGGGMTTWTQVSTVQFNGTLRRITVFRALQTSPGSGTLTIDFGGTTQIRCNWSVVQFTGIQTTGTNGADAIVQAVTNTGSGNPGSVTLAAFATAENATFGAIGSSITGNITPGTGFTEIHDPGSAGGENQNVQTQFRNDNDTSVDWTPGASSAWGAIGIEIGALIRSPRPTANQQAHGAENLNAEIVL